MPIRLIDKRQVLDQFIRELEDEVRAIAVTLDQAIVSRTPVDTGRARANWFMDFGSVRVRTTDAVSSPDTSRARRWRLGQGNIIIHNSVDYIEFLDDGSSAQAPQGIVDPAFAAVRARFG